LIAGKEIEVKKHLSLHCISLSLHHFEWPALVGQKISRMKGCETGCNSDPPFVLYMLFNFALSFRYLSCPISVIG
jgi:hypothetical protein